MTTAFYVFDNVWLCSGQSNMQLTVEMICNGTEEIANAGTTLQVPSGIPVEEVPTIEENWSVASPTSIGGSMWTYMSAVCWLYGRMIHQELNARPIRLIATS
jgi:sialate O-acetylesterase